MPVGYAQPVEVQQSQALLTLVWSALLLDEEVTRATVLAALAVIVCVVWGRIGRVHQERPRPRNERKRSAALAAIGAAVPSAPAPVAQWIEQRFPKPRR